MGYNWSEIGRLRIDLNFQHDPFATFSTVMNESVDNRMFPKTDDSKRIRKTQNKKACDLFLLLKSSILQNFLILSFFLFFLPLSSVTHSPIQPRYFGVFFSGKSVGG